MQTLYQSYGVQIKSCYMVRQNILKYRCEIENIFYKIIEK